MLTAFAFWLAAASPADSILGEVRRAVAVIHDTADARAAGYVPLARGRDHSPFQGQHWLRRDLVSRGGDDVSRPPFLMFAVVGGRFELVGVAYSRRLPHEALVPDALDGVPATWHAHVGCIGRPEQPLGLAPSSEACRAEGGTAAPRKLAMVHVWLGPSPDGAFAGENPALPYLALGLPAPSMEALHDPSSRGAAMTLGLALGESYGARLPAAVRITQAADSAGRARLEAARIALRMEVRALQVARDDEVQAAAMRGRVLAAWDGLAAAYQAEGSAHAAAAFRAECATTAAGGGHHHHAAA